MTYRKRPGFEMITSLADILPGVCENLGMERKVNELALRALWPSQLSILGSAEMARQSKAVRIQKQGGRTILNVRVSNATLASEMGFLLPQLKEALNSFTPQTGIHLDQIRIQVGSI